MSEQLPSVEIQCEAPSYSVVRACAAFGFQSPLDVRWSLFCRYRISQQATQPLMSSLASLLPATGWLSTVNHCNCGAAIPQLQPFGFLMPEGKILHYVLAQCPRCKTMYWDPA